MEKKDILLRVEHLSKYFGGRRNEFRAVDDVSFYIERGEVFGLVGESGCGKTTVGRTVIGLYPPTSGEIYLDGELIAVGTRSYLENIKSAKEKCRQELAGATTKEERMRHKAEFERTLRENRTAIKEAEQRVRKSGDITSRIQMIFQDPSASLDPRMTVREIIAEGLVIRGGYQKEEIERHVMEMLELVGLLPEHASRYPHEFSGGQRQRIGIARAVIMSPELIIADEPVSALDVSVQAQVINLLDDLRRRFGMAVLFVAHDLSVVKYFCDRIGVMYFGKIVECAPSDELFKNPLHPYTRSLLSAIPLPDPIYERGRKRIIYEGAADSDSSELPLMREVCCGHFVMCTESEFKKYREETK